MDCSNVAQKIKEIEIYTRRLMSGKLIGDRTSIVKGSGLNFDQLRDYSIGDDVRFIDWNSSARMNKLLIKQFYEERDRIIILAIDISGSSFYGTEFSKQEAMGYVSGMLALAADGMKDQVGLILFSDVIHTYIPPKKGRKHIRLLLEKIFTSKNNESKTSIATVLDFIAQLKKKNAIVFVVSDFVSDDFAKKLPSVARMYDLIAIRFNHRYEKEFPSVGLLTVRDIETGQEVIIDTRKANRVNQFLKNRWMQQKELFARNKVDVLEMTPESEPLPALISFFAHRKK